MRTMFINGSPKGENANSATFIKEITKYMDDSTYETRTLLTEKNPTLIKGMKAFDTVIIVMPLYIHAMPSIVMQLFEQMEVNTIQKKRLGFIVQAGFEESETAKYLVDYLEVFCKRMQYEYMGTIVKPGAAGLALMPRFFFRKLFKQLHQLEKEYNEKHIFSQQMIDSMGYPYQLSTFQVRLFSSRFASSINKVGWHHYLKKNHAFAQRNDTPFLK